MTRSLDQQGNAIKIGVAYQFVFAMPGPDVTCLVVESINADGTLQCYDVHFQMRIESVKPDRLWRPLKHTWAAWPGDVKAVTNYVGAQALDLT